MTHMPRTGTPQRWLLTWQRMRPATLTRVTATLADEDIFPVESDVDGMTLDVEYALARRAVYLIRQATGKAVLMTEVT